jgi:phosphoribosylamine--glycine ligase
MNKTINIGILGSGGREHAIAWKVSQSPLLNKLFLIPGNGGTHSLAENLKVKLSINE